MHILIIGSTKEATTPRDREYYQEYVDFFTKSAQASGEDITPFTTMISDLIISVGDGNLSIYDTFNDKDLTEYGVIFMRGSGFRDKWDFLGTIDSFAKENGIKIINSYDGVRDMSKLLQATRFHELKAPVARSIPVNSAVLNHFDKVQGWEFPAILKASLGSHGNDNYLVKDFDEVKRIATEFPQKRFILQRFVPNDGDYRVLIIGDEVFVIGRAAVEGSHLNNTSKGGIATDVAVDTLPEAVIQQSRAIARAMGMTIAGVDVLQDKQTGEYFFLEVNSQPQIMSGAFLDKKIEIVGRLLKKLNEEA